MSSLINYSSCLGLLSCYCKCLLRALILSSYGSVVCAVYNRLNEALGCDIKAIYVLRAYYVIYYSCGMASFCTLLCEFVVFVG